MYKQPSQRNDEEDELRRNGGLMSMTAQSPAVAAKIADSDV